jgi:hypothetical protein
LPGPGLGFAQGWQEHSRQNGDDGDHHQQFNEGERPALPVWSHWRHESTFVYPICYENEGLLWPIAGQDEKESTRFKRTQCGEWREQSQAAPCFSLFREG